MSDTPYGEETSSSRIYLAELDELDAKWLERSRRENIRKRWEMRRLMRSQVLIYKSEGMTNSPIGEFTYITYYESQDNFYQFYLKGIKK